MGGRSNCKNQIPHAFKNQRLYRERSKKEYEDDPDREIENLVDKIFTKKRGCRKCDWNVNEEEYKEIIHYR